MEVRPATILLSRIGIESSECGYEKSDVKKKEATPLQSVGSCLIARKKYEDVLLFENALHISQVFYLIYLLFNFCYFFYAWNIIDNSFSTVFNFP